MIEAIDSKKTVRTQGGYMHPRCYRNKATERFLVLGNQGTQFLDVDSGESWLHYWLRGTCQYGILPANGLLYVPPHAWCRVSHADFANF